MIYLKTLLFLSVLVRTSLGFAADHAAMLTVTTQNAPLYASQDNEGKVVTTLRRGEVLKPLVQGVGSATWYMVKTAKGVVGWIQAVDVASTQRTDEVFRDSSEVNATDMTPKTQAEANTANSKREAEERAKAEARAEAARQRAAELHRQTVRAQTELEKERIRARGEVEAAEKRRPDTCVNCVLLR